MPIRYVGSKIIISFALILSVTLERSHSIHGTWAPTVESEIKVRHSDRLLNRKPVIVGVNVKVA